MTGEHEARVDAHTRLLLRMHGCLHADLVLPSLARIGLLLDAKAGSAEGLAELEALHRSFVPAPWTHPDDFLVLSMLRGPPRREVAS
jgi:hypothetical protein